MIKKLFIPATNSLMANLALLALRIWLGGAVAGIHGLEKIRTFSQKSQGFPDPFGIGSPASLGLATFAEFFCALLLIAGLVTRFAALVVTVNMAVAFILVHKMVLAGAHSGELAFVYLAGFTVLLIAGPGRFSADAVLFK